ncbi:cell wall protein PhiA [Colletotrichum falcatum]|nr:cell wall protein PhiA [Colletotrichum falcatum]
MQLTNALAVVASLASAVSASSIPAHIYNRQNGTAPRNFKVQVVNINSTIHLQHFQANSGSILVGLPNQGAACDNTPDQPTEQEATFTLDPDSTLFLYTGQEEPQQTFADRSGMGQGKFGYTTGAQPAPRNGERAGWAIDAAGYLTLQGAGFIACPNSIDGAWVIWVDAGKPNPAGYTNCIPIAARTVEIPKPVGCEYTSN